MELGHAALRIAHLSSINCGSILFDEGLMRRTVEAINKSEPDLVVMAGDFTQAGYEWEFKDAVGWLSHLEAPVMAVPGNHDSRNVGYLHFERMLGERFRSHRVAFDDERARRLHASGITVVCTDSSEPDLDEGHVGREWYDWIRDQYTEPDDLKAFVVHHHLVSVPGAGRGLNVIVDAGDLLPILTDLNIDIVLTGHKHVPSFWGLNGLLIANAGTAATRMVRGTIPPSWTELRVDASSIKGFLHYEDGRRELSLLRSRSARRRIQRAFYVTPDFFDANQVLISSAGATPAAVRS